MNAALAKALSQEAIAKNDILIDKSYDTILEDIFKCIKHEAEEGYKSYMFRFNNYCAIFNGNLKHLNGPGQRSVMKRLAKELRALGYIAGGNWELGENNFIKIEWSN